MMAIDRSVNAFGQRHHSPGPHLDMPSPCFTSTEMWNAERIGAVVMYCSDGRWGEAFDEFCHRKLRLPRYDRFAVPGGPVCLLPGEAGEGFCRGAWEQIDFLVRAHEIRRVVLIAHYGCAYYALLYGQSPDEYLAAQVADMHAASEALDLWFRGIEVESYVAMRRAGLLSFHPA